MRAKGCGKIGFSGARRTQTEYQLMRAHEVDIRSLRGRSRPGDFARSGSQMPPCIARRAVVRWRGKGNFRVDIAEREIFAGLQPLIERAQNRCCMLARLRCAFHGNQIASLRHSYTESLLQTHEIAAVAPDKGGKQRVALEFECHLLAAGYVGLAISLPAAQCASAFSQTETVFSNTPFKLFGKTDAIFTSRIAPIKSAAPSTWTGCK